MAEIIKNNKKPKKSSKAKNNNSILEIEVSTPLWLSVSEAAKIGGITSKTIRRALSIKAIKYKVVKNRYSLDFASIIKFLNTKTKLKNKLNQKGIGQYIVKWRK